MACCWGVDTERASEEKREVTSELAGTPVPVTTRSTFGICRNASSNKVGIRTRGARYLPDHTSNGNQFHHSPFGCMVLILPSKTYAREWLQRTTSRITEGRTHTRSKEKGT